MTDKEELKRCAGIECDDRHGCARFTRGRTWPFGPLAHDLRAQNAAGECLNFVPWKTDAAKH